MGQKNPTVLKCVKNFLNVLILYWNHSIRSQKSLFQGRLQQITAYYMLDFSPVYCSNFNKRKRKTNINSFCNAWQPSARQPSARQLDFIGQSEPRAFYNHDLFTKTCRCPRLAVAQAWLWTTLYPIDCTPVCPAGIKGNQDALEVPQALCEHEWLSFHHRFFQIIAGTCHSRYCSVT